MSKPDQKQPAEQPFKVAFRHVAGGYDYGLAPAIELIAERFSGGIWHVRTTCKPGESGLRNTRQAWAAALRELAHYVERLPEE